MTPARISLALYFAVSVSAAPRTITWNQDVAPLMAQQCVGCHKAGEIGPMAFTSYKETRPWAQAIRQAVLQGTMPPWHADAGTTPHFKNARVLSQDERDILVGWAESGAAEGAAVERETVVEEQANGWRLGKPDFIARVPGYKVPASGT